MPATASDVGELFTLQRACWVQEALANQTLAIPALHESLGDVLASLDSWDTYVVRQDGRLVGSARGRLNDGEYEVGRLMVAPDLQGRGLGRRLLAHIMDTAPAGTPFVLTAGARSVDNQRMYRAAGFELSAPHGEDTGVVQMRRGPTTQPAGAPGRWELARSE